MKYKIFKFTDGNGREWYQVKKKAIVFWYWIHRFYGTKWGSRTLKPNSYSIRAFATLEVAQKWVEEDIEMCQYLKKSEKIKIMKCAEI